MQVLNVKGGINLRVAPWHEDMEQKNQCVLMQNYRYKNEFFETIPGTRKYHGTSMGSNPITAIMPYYNDQNDNYALLVATGGKILKRNEVSNEFEELLSGLTPNSIFSSVIRHGVQYIASINDGLKKYEGGTQVYSVGGGDTAPGSFRQILWMKEIDRLFGISDNAIYGQITWSNLGDPEVWDGANVERIKLKDGERVEGAEVLYGKLIIFCTYTVWIYYVSGNEENWKLEEAPTTVGCVAPNTIKKIGSEIWYLGESPKYQLGVYAFTGSNSKLLTGDVEPLFKSVNPNKVRNACAEVHDDLYTISWSTDFSETNNVSIDLDIANYKEDSTPAIYGVHTFGFYSSAVLNSRQKRKEFLMGSETSGFVLQEVGNTFNSVNGTDGDLIPLRFISRVHIDDLEYMNMYSEIKVFFRPRGNFNAKLRYYLGTGAQHFESIFQPSTQTVAFSGDFNSYEFPLKGVPSIYPHEEFLSVDSIGTSIQIELVNETIAERLDFEGYAFTSKKLYKAQRPQMYA